MAWPTIVKTPSTFTVAPNLGDYERVRASFSWADARRELAGLPGGRPQHRPRGDRPARGGAAARPSRAPLARKARRDRGLHLRPAAGAHEPLRERPGGARRGQGRPGLRPGRPPSRALRRRPRHAQAPERVLPALLRLRPRADPGALGHRPGEGAGDHGLALRPESGGVAPAPAAPRARPAGRRRPPADRRCQGPTTTTGSWPGPATASRSGRPIRRIRHSSTSRAAPPARQRARSTSTRRSWLTTSPGGWRSTSTRTTSSGAPPIPAG